MASLPDYEMYKAAEKARIEMVEKLSDVEDINVGLVYQPVTATGVSAGDAMGGTPLGLVPTQQQCEIDISVKYMSCSALIIV